METTENKIHGFKKLICPNCVQGNKNSKRKGTYKVFETNKNYLLVCAKCGHKKLIKKEEGNQLKVTLK
jgi:hypothetical protein